MPPLPSRRIRAPSRSPTCTQGRKRALSVAPARSARGPPPITVISRESSTPERSTSASPFCATASKSAASGASAPTEIAPDCDHDWKPFEIHVVAPGRSIGPSATRPSSATSSDASRPTRTSGPSTSRRSAPSATSQRRPVPSGAHAASSPTHAPRIRASGRRRIASVSQSGPRSRLPSSSQRSTGTPASTVVPASSGSTGPSQATRSSSAIAILTTHLLACGSPGAPARRRGSARAGRGAAARRPSLADRSGARPRRRRRARRAGRS